MKHLLRGLSFVVLFLALGLQQVMAQNMPPIPVDKNVRIGKLDNGLTYYIRHNEYPENRVEFYIAQKVGAILEEPEQRGLAHFLEHMAFNGTKNFPGDETGLGIIPWCETKGIKFGANLNAYTGVDETVYNISNVPTTNVNVVDSCLLILHDWSNALLLTGEEIEKERGVIREEWRSRNSGFLRIITDAFPVIYEGTKYTDCLPIGSIDVINNFPYERIREYYHKWYRPDLQGIFIVGDIDVDQMEQKIKSTFADIKAPVNPAERIYYPVGDNDEPIVYIGKDKEVATPSIEIFFKNDAYPDSLKNNVGYLVQNYLASMITSMLNSRLNELAQTANPPYTSAYSNYGDFFVAKTKSAFTLSGNAKNDGVHKCLLTLLEEAERARRFGFTASEYERAKANYMQRLESSYKERAKTESDSYVQEYVRNFIENEPIPGIEYEFNIMSQISPNITVEVINQVIKQLIIDKNQVVLIGGPDKEGVDYPTTEEVVNLLKDMKNFDLEPYKDEVSDEPLISEDLKGGEIVSESEGEVYGTTKLELSNGVTVYLKQTDFKDDEIVMFAGSLGGKSLYSDEDALELQQFNNVATLGGFGNFSKVNLNKVLAGKKVGTWLSLGQESENIGGTSSPKDFETLMQLTYLNFTAPRKDDEAFQSYKTKMRAKLEGAKSNPMSAFKDSLSTTISGHSPRVIVMTPELVDEIDYDRVLEIYKERFADASQFTFTFVGNIDVEKMKPLIAKYLGSLPSLNKEEGVGDHFSITQKGMVDNIFAKEQETPMATIFYLFSGDCNYTLKNKIVSSFVYQILDNIYTEEIREKEGGTYGVSSYASIERYPNEHVSMQIFFQTDPAKAEYLGGKVLELLEDFAKNGCSEEKISKVREYILKKYTDNQKENNYWVNSLVEYLLNGVDDVEGYVEIVNSITVDDLKNFTQNLLNQENRIQVVMTVPEAE